MVIDVLSFAYWTCRMHVRLFVWKMTLTSMRLVLLYTATKLHLTTSASYPPPIIAISVKVVQRSNNFCYEYDSIQYCLIGLAKTHAKHVIESTVLFNNSLVSDKRYVVLTQLPRNVYVIIINDIKNAQDILNILTLIFMIQFERKVNISVHQFVTKLSIQIGFRPDL